jgi:hypothetical protein
MNCSICLEQIEPFFDAKISSCSHYFCAMCAVNLVKRKCLLCDNREISTLEKNCSYAHYERFINSDDYGIRLYNLSHFNQNFNYPSVTSVTSLIGYVGFKIFRNKKIREIGKELYEQESKLITDRGTLVHLVIEKYLKDPANFDIYSKGQVAGDIAKSMMVFLKKINSIKLQEQVIFSHELKIAGQVDCVAYYNGLLSVIDFKSAIKRKPKNQPAYFSQCAAYAACFEETYNEKIQQLVLIIGIISENDSQILIQPYSEKEVASFKKLRSEFLSIFQL